jgi:hypothetical protein
MLRTAMWPAWIEHDRWSRFGYNRAISLHTGEGSAGGIHGTHCIMSLPGMVEPLTFVRAVGCDGVHV